jgi:hypothetical protein
MNAVTKSKSPKAKKDLGLTVLKASFTPLLSNAADHLHELNKIAPRSAFFARASILGTLGYAVCNQLIWANRRSRAAINEAAPDIDIFNDECANKSVVVAGKRNADEQGMVELPEWDAMPLAGVFKSILAHQNGEQLAKQFRPTMPHEIIRGIFSNNNETEIDAAYAELINKEIGNSAAAEAIRKAMGVLDVKLDAKQIADHKFEENAVLKHLQFVATDDLTDEAWETIPMFVQYRFTYAVYKQALKAFAFIMKTNRRPDESASRLIQMIDTLTLELQAAGRTTQVRLAFDLERMGSTENIVTEIESAPGADMAPTNTPAVEKMIDGKIQKIRTRQPQRV